MAMSDPFSTTAELAYRSGSSLGEGVLSAAGMYAKRKEAQRMRDRGHQLLQQFGIVKPDDSIDTEKARSAGVEISSDGTVTIKPVHQTPTLAEQIGQIQTLERAKHKGEVPSTTGFTSGKEGMQLKSASMTGLSEEDKNALAKQMIEGKLAPNQLPAFGQSRAEVLKTIAKTNPEFSAKQADLDFFGQRIGTNNLQRLYTNLTPAENTFNRNADLMLQISNEYTRSNSPALNKALLVWRGKAEGDPDTARIIAAAWAVASEYAKLVTNNGFTGSLTDTARREVENVLSATMNQGQVKALLDPKTGVMRLEARNRIAGLEDKMSEYGIPIPTSNEGSQIANFTQQGIKQGRDEFGFTFGDKKYSKKLKRELTYIGSNQWQ